MRWSALTIGEGLVTAVLLLAAGALVAPAAASQLFVVTPDGTGDYPTIQAAINAAGNGDIVELTDGDFTGPGNRDIDFLGKSITLRSQSSDPDICRIRIWTTPDDPQRGFYLHSGETASARVEHIGVVCGIAAGGSWPDNCGGGALCVEGSSPTFFYCDFVDCEALNGGNVYCHGGSNPHFDHCLIGGGQAGNAGGGVFLHTDCEPVFTGGYLLYNTAGGSGGALYCYNGCAPQLTSTSLHHNTSLSETEGGGAIALFAGSTVTLEDGDISNNTAANHGGGLFTNHANCTVNLIDTDIYYNDVNETSGIGGGLYVEAGTATCTNCTVFGNESWNGGGMAFLEGATGTVVGCYFTGQELSSNGVGGSVYMDNATADFQSTMCAFENAAAGAGISAQYSTLTMTNCNFTSCDGTFGGGVRLNPDCTAEIEGCTFENCSGTTGCGIYLRRSDATVSNCDFLGNYTATSDSSNGSAAAQAWDGGDVTFTNCLFQENSGRRGGALGIYSVTSCAIENCQFTLNTALQYNGWGGAILIEDAATTITGCQFNDNSAIVGGAIAVRPTPSAVIEDCTFTSNDADPTMGTGGAIYIEDDDDTEITSCTFFQNSATWGGGISCWMCADPTITACEFIENSAVTQGGGLRSHYDSDPHLSACTFTDCVADLGGGVYAQEGDPVFTQCEFTGNEATNGAGCYSYDADTQFDLCTFDSNSADYAGGGIYLWGGDSEVTNCTFYGNDVVTNGSGVYVRDTHLVMANTIIANGSAGGAVYCNAGGSATLTCCDIYHNGGDDWDGCIADQYGVNGNLAVNPEFCLADNPEEPFTLKNTSLCAAENNPECGLIGAWVVGCSSSAVDDGDVAGITALQLARPTPNPFSSVTHLTFAIPPAAADEPVTLTVFDASGRVVRVLRPGRVAAGSIL